MRPMAGKHHRWRWLALAVVLLGIDQAIKFVVTQTMQLHDSFPVIAGFNWVYVLNPGAAFSFLADAGGWQRYFFSALAFAVTAVLSVVLWRGVASRIEALAYSLLIAGAMGNATDRLHIGAVVDYLNVYWRTWHWPAFNFADICINVAALLILVSAWQQATPANEKKEEHHAA
jgi:signal peptidase II